MLRSVGLPVAYRESTAVQQLADQGQRPPENLFREIADRIERIRSLAANSDIGGEAEGHQIGHECKQILSSISALG
jgi:hypothetical protein